MATMMMLRRARQPLVAVSKGYMKTGGLRFASSSTEFKNVLVEQRGRVGIITFNRPETMNQLNNDMILDICAAAEAFEGNDGVGALVLTGSGEDAFAAGAKFMEFAGLSFAEAYKQDVFRVWDRLTNIRKPLIAAVNGFALGGGSELAMMCDIIYAGEKAQFGQPETSIGLIPGWGGTQRLTRAIGKSKSMEMILTGDYLNARQAKKYGLVSKVYPAAELVEKTIELADKIANKSLPVTLLAKEAVNAAYEGSLADGLHLERRLVHSAFALDDEKEGTSAFDEGRDPVWTHQ